MKKIESKSKPSKKTEKNNSAPQLNIDSAAKRTEAFKRHTDDFVANALIPALKARDNDNPKGSAVLIVGHSIRVRNEIAYALGKSLQKSEPTVFIHSSFAKYQDHSVTMLIRLLLDQVMATAESYFSESIGDRLPILKYFRIDLKKFKVARDRIKVFHHEAVLTSDYEGISETDKKRTGNEQQIGASVAAGHAVPSIPSINKDADHSKKNTSPKAEDKKTDDKLVNGIQGKIEGNLRWFSEHSIEQTRKALRPPDELQISNYIRGISRIAEILACYDRGNKKAKLLIIVEQIAKTTAPDLLIKRLLDIPSLSKRIILIAACPSWIMDSDESERSSVNILRLENFDTYSNLVHGIAESEKEFAEKHLGQPDEYKKLISNYVKIVPNQAKHKDRLYTRLIETSIEYFVINNEFAQEKRTLPAFIKLVENQLLDFIFRELISRFEIRKELILDEMALVIDYLAASIRSGTRGAIIKKSHVLALGVYRANLLDFFAESDNGDLYLLPWLSGIIDDFHAKYMRFVNLIQQYPESNWYAARLADINNPAGCIANVIDSALEENYARLENSLLTEQAHKMTQEGASLGYPRDLGRTMPPLSMQRPPWPPPQSDLIEVIDLRSSNNYLIWIIGSVGISLVLLVVWVLFIHS